MQYEQVALTEPKTGLPKALFKKGKDYLKKTLRQKATEIIIPAATEPFVSQEILTLAQALVCATLLS